MTATRFRAARRDRSGAAFGASSSIVASPVAHDSVPVWEQVATASLTGYAMELAASALDVGAVWKSGRMPVSGTPLAGVGDEAVWVNDLTEVVSEQNDLLCDIQVTGLAAVLNHQPAAAKQKAIGALCNKIFAEVK